GERRSPRDEGADLKRAQLEKRVPVTFQEEEGVKQKGERENQGGFVQEPIRFSRQERPRPEDRHPTQDEERENDESQALVPIGYGEMNADEERDAEGRRNGDIPAILCGERDPFEKCERQEREQRREKKDVGGESEERRADQECAREEVGAPG